VTTALHNEYVLVAHGGSYHCQSATVALASLSISRLTDRHARLAITELAELDIARPHAQAIAYAVHERRVRATRKHLRLPHLHLQPLCVRGRLCVSQV